MCDQIYERVTYISKNASRKWSENRDAICRPESATYLVQSPHIAD